MHTFNTTIHIITLSEKIVDGIMDYADAKALFILARGRI